MATGTIVRVVLLGAATGVAGCDSDKDACLRVVCDFTRVAVSVVDADGDEGTASEVYFTIHPYSEGSTKMTEDELDEAEVDITEKHDAACVEAEDGSCPAWNAAAGFGEYTISGILNDEDSGDQLDTDQIVVSLPYPDGPPDDCCGYTDSTTGTLTLDEEGESETSDSGG